MGVYCSSEGDTTQDGKFDKNMEPRLRRTPSFRATAKASSRVLSNEARKAWIQEFEQENPDFIRLEAIVDENIHVSVVETVFSNGDRALHKAVREGKLDLTIFLIVNCGARINVPTEHKASSPLIIATTNYDIEMIRLLLDKHEEYSLFGAKPADPHYTDFAGESAIDIASRTADESLWELLCPVKKIIAEIEHKTEDVIESRSASPYPMYEEDERIPFEAKEEEIEVPEKVEEVEDGEEVEEVKEIEWKAGFVNKRKPDVFRGWQLRYLSVNGDFIGWATDAIDVDGMMDKDKFNSYAYLDTVDRVEAVDSDSQCKFQFHVVNATKTHEPREYEFKADTTEERDEWVRIIKRAVLRARE